MNRKSLTVTFFLLSLISGFTAFAQREITAPKNPKIFDKTLNGSYKTGEEGFFRYMSLTLRYPAKARTNGVMGLSVFAFKVNCDNKPYSLQFKTKLGFGIEEEIESLIKKTEGHWLPCSERDTVGWINVKVGFTINGLYNPEDSFIVLTAHGDFPGVSDDTLINDLRKATEKNKTKNMRAALTKLVMRFPYNQEYRTKLNELPNE
jgi:hypothetical protein